MKGRFPAVIACAMGTILLAGCLEGGGQPERKYGKVSGTVTYKGAPVKQGDVNYQSPSTGGAATGKITDGKFEIPELMLGKYDISITPTSEGAPPEPGKPRPPAEAADIPEKYREFKSSGFSQEVKEGSNSHDFKME